MKTMISLVWYNAAVYARTTKIVMPLAALLVFFTGIYGMRPLEVVDSFAFSAPVCFGVMAWIGLGHTETEDPVSQQILVLKAGGAWKYDVANTLLLLGISGCISLLAVAFPLGMHVAGGPLFKRSLTPEDIAAALALHVAMSFMGGCVGCAFHPRLMANRKLALLLVAFVVVVGFAKAGIHKAFPAAVAVTWLFPPVSDIAGAFAGLDFFTWGSVGFAVGVSLLYGTALAALRIALLSRRKF